MRFTLKTTAALALATGCAAALSACGGSGSSSGGAEKCAEPMMIAHATNEVWSITPMIAEKEGIFEKNKVKVDKQVLFEGDSQVAQVLQAGQADVGLASGYSILGTLDSGRPMVMTSLLAAKETDMLVVKPDVIKQPSELKGKVMAVNDVGGGTHASTVWGLEELGVDPESVTLTQVGAQEDRLAAIIGGSAATGPIDRAVRDDVEKQGLKVLVDLADTDLESSKHGVIFMKKFVEECPDQVEAFTRSLAEAQDVLLNDPDKAGTILANWQETKPADGIKIVNDAHDLIAVQTCLAPTELAFKTSLDFLKQTNDAVKDVDPKDAYTTEFTDKLVEDGTFEELGLDCTDSAG